MKSLPCDPGGFSRGCLARVRPREIEGEQPPGALGRREAAAAGEETRGKAGRLHASR